MTITSTAPVGGGAAAQAGNIGIQDFLKILTSQLNNQDPLKPIDNQDFVAQIAQFASLEQSRQLNEKLDSLLTAQSSMQSIGLLGKTIDIDKNGNTLTGKVSALDLSSGQPLLTITTSSGQFESGISLAQVITIR
ncbi:flagellar hook capping protein [Massilia forsythiae]|uniref:Basal-body rod modification protein FlgD n=1 Tax=Massilia forsythiae TaxID=2728020 RepID=A0A7Z2VU18_9BURK|nr:flagellar hook capping FlgD N-terminal domain-containing protein [Massilia forsythiae]QJD99482.1 flagellar hook capping protein [Massilia forsythiae]